MTSKSLTCISFFTYHTIGGLLAQVSDKTSGTCTYTFTVNEVSPICTTGSASVTNLKEESKKIDLQIADVKMLVQKLQDEVDGLKNTKSGQVGASYVCWGRKVCPNSATLVYDGKKIEIVYVIAMLTNTYLYVNIEQSLNQALVKIHYMENKMKHSKLSMYSFI